MRETGENVPKRIGKTWWICYNSGMEIVSNLTVALDTTDDQLLALACRRIGWMASWVRTFVKMRRSIDARRHPVKWVYTVALSREVEAVPCYAPPVAASLAMRPVVVGFGPAGMLCALSLAESGLCPIVLERGYDVDTRTALVREFWRSGRLDPRCNVQFGEGGAGAFSDGKLNTGTGDKLMQRYVLETFVRHGADPSILVDAKPHVGTDKLARVVRGIRERIIALGGEVHFGEPVEDVVSQEDGVELVTPCARYRTQHAVLAVGHSARDTYQALYKRGYGMEGKPFAVGLRVEHLQEDVSRALYGADAGNPLLPPADYKLVSHTPYGGVYTFCMCPGGYVVASSSEEGTVVTNGMSYFVRDGRNANAAVLVGVTPDQLGGDLFAGMRLQEEMERRAYTLGGGDYRAPVQLLGDFVSGRCSASFGRVQPTYTPGTSFARLDEALPLDMTPAMRLAFADFGRKIKGYDAPDAVLTGFETRSSAPVRVLRGEDMRAVGNPYVYPCGEGCGYAGGIMSAATDGLKVAEIIARSAR